MSEFLSDDFLLSDENAAALYHGIAEGLPIIDIGGHARDMFYRFTNIYEFLIGVSSEKKAIIRACGADEDYITGNASDYDKFKVFAAVLPRLAGSGLYTHTHLQLKRYFGYSGLLDLTSCDDVWKLGADKLAERGGLSLIGDVLPLETVCAGFDPCFCPSESLPFISPVVRHNSNILKSSNGLLSDDTDFNAPPVLIFNGLINSIVNDNYSLCIKNFSNLLNQSVFDLNSLKVAVQTLMTGFEEYGCRIAHLDFDFDSYSRCSVMRELDRIFASALNKPSDAEASIPFRLHMTEFLASECMERGWTLDLSLVNPSKGSVHALRSLIANLKKHGKLPRTVINFSSPEILPCLFEALNEFTSLDISGLPGIMTGIESTFSSQRFYSVLTQYGDVFPSGALPGFKVNSPCISDILSHEIYRRSFCSYLSALIDKGVLPFDFDLLSDLTESIFCGNPRMLLL